MTRKPRANITRDARIDSDWAQVERRTRSIMGRAISSPLQSEGTGGLYRIYLASI